MASRYVPPHLRKRAENEESKTPSNNTDRTKPASEALIRRRLSDLKFNNGSNRSLHTIQELNRHYGSTLVHSTLRDTASKPGELGFVILFRNANPRWRSDRIIFAHTNIDILPGYANFKEQLAKEQPNSKEDKTNKSSDGLETVSTTSESFSNDRPRLDNNNNNTTTDSEVSPPVHPNRPKPKPKPKPKADGPNTPNPPTNPPTNPPIPIFAELHKPTQKRTFTFHGYFKLTHIDFLKPHSPELILMLQQKWQQPTQQHNPNAPPPPPPPRPKHRDPSAWAKSLSQEWAVLHFEPIPKDQVPDDPKIEVLSSEEEERGEGEEQHEPTTTTPQPDRPTTQWRPLRP